MKAPWMWLLKALSGNLAVPEPYANNRITVIPTMITTQHAPSLRLPHMIANFASAAVAAQLVLAEPRVGEAQELEPTKTQTLATKFNILATMGSQKRN